MLHRFTLGCCLGVEPRLLYKVLKCSSVPSVTCRCRVSTQWPLILFPLNTVQPGRATASRAGLIFFFVIISHRPLFLFLFLFHPSACRCFGEDTCITIPDIDAVVMVLQPSEPRITITGVERVSRPASDLSTPGGIALFQDLHIISTVTRADATAHHTGMDCNQHPSTSIRAELRATSSLIYWCLKLHIGHFYNFWGCKWYNLNGKKQYFSICIWCCLPG